MAIILTFKYHILVTAPVKDTHGTTLLYFCLRSRVSCYIYQTELAESPGLLIKEAKVLTTHNV